MSAGAASDTANGKRKIRALFVMAGYHRWCGADRSLLDLLGRLDKNRIEPSLLFLKKQDVHLEQLPENVGVSWVSDSEKRLRYRVPSIVRNALHHGSRADVIVGAMETTSTYVAWVAAKVLRKPLVGWVRMDLDEYLASHPGWHRQLARRIYPQCAAVVVPSAGSARSLQRVAPLSANTLCIVPVPVDPEEVRAMASEPLSSSLRLLLAKPFMVGVGWLRVRHKGFDTLIRAHASARRRGLDHNLLLIGEGEDREMLRQLASSLGVEDSVFMPGYLRNPFPLIRAAVALAAPSRLESFGRVYLEAMALGLPVIGSTASGPTEILDGGKYGMIVPAEDVEALSDAMGTLLGDAAAHSHYSRLALARSNEYRPEHVALQWDELLCNLAGTQCESDCVSCPPG